jgi:hypothetical protein
MLIVHLHIFFEVSIQKSLFFIELSFYYLFVGILYGSLIQVCYEINDMKVNFFIKASWDIDRDCILSIVQFR